MKSRKNILIPFSLLLFSGLFYLYSTLVQSLHLEIAADGLFLRILDKIDPIVASLVYFSWEVPPDKVSIEPISLILFFIDTGLAIGLLKIPRIFRKIVLARSIFGLVYGIFLLFLLISGGDLPYLISPIIWLSLHGTIIYFVTRK